MATKKVHICLHNPNFSIFFPEWSALIDSCLKPVYLGRHDNKMKVVGLLSGGKDSCYNLLHCVQQGHEIVALATLAPALGEKDELDSYMYQTVGHDVVHLVAQAMQLPLYRQTITGTAINQSSEYGSRIPGCSRNVDADALSAQRDETEDLHALLKQVKRHHPDIQAVSVGAILSNYQRTRVEHVCFRDSIQLQPLTYLWQRSQAKLLAEMTSPSAAPFTSILIKVAGIGLTQDDLGKSLHQMQPKLVKLNQLYGAHICGEGGEYETLTLDSPLFVQKIVIDAAETVIHSDSAFGSVSYLRITQAHLESKSEVQATPQVPTPRLFDNIGRRTSDLPSQTEYTAATTSDDVAFCTASLRLPIPSTICKGRWYTFANITGEQAPALSLEQEVLSAFRIASTMLQCHSLDLTHAVHVNLYLADQLLFSSVNAVYKTHFGVSPPTRACVALNLPNLSATGSRSTPRFVMSVIAFDESTPSDTKSRNRGERGSWAAAGERKALHVQSRSFWAPANIGPYSQAVVPARTDRIYIAGQIGLMPSDLSLPSVAMQNILAIQHARRIYGAVMGDMASRDTDKGWIEGGICWVESDNLSGARDAWLAQIPSDSDDDDNDGAQFANDQDGMEAEVCWLGKHVSDSRSLPPMMFVSLGKGSLPRGAAIEWQLTAHTGRVVSGDVAHTFAAPMQGHSSDDGEEDDEVGMDAPSPTLIRSSFTLGPADHVNGRGIYQLLQSRKTQSSFGILSFSTPPMATSVDQTLRAALQEIAASAYSKQLFYVPSDGMNPQSMLQSLDALGADTALETQCQYIPVDNLHVLDPLAADAMQLQPASLALVWHGT